MEYFKIKNKNYSLEDKYSFSVEIAFIGIFVGSFFTSLFISLAYSASEIFSQSVINLVYSGLTIFLKSLFITIFTSIIPFIILAFILRGLIFILEQINIDSRFKLFLLLLFQFALVIIFSHIVNIKYINISTSLMLLLIAPYLFTLTFYSLYRNIWNIKFSKN